ncbi:alpha/beta hydrolase [Cronbergia sp. UHCC 0137]|uniref:alpha/beta fold hydrolase n=1 Tax=Cronbergia sp. UHCC 0137 TaxID=3110239 RepID=UPI002B1F243B|nr:alpha/beta hydrolase [Cronbergia sp. UHCC 0137]MEA5620068.1 alpha/beta hydrolase [Cronbergia sp. UHCC 0137]
MKDWWQVNFPQGQQSLTITDASGYPVKIAYGEKGTGKPLILLHGLGSWSYNWRHSIEPLSKYFRVICCDAKGFGFSEKPLGRREEEGHQIIELKRIIQALCDEPPVVVAESLGALIALALAGQNPDTIGHLVVINAPIFTDKLPHWAMGLLAKMPLEIVEIIDKLRLPYLFAPLVKEVMAIERRKVLFDPSILTEEDIYWITYPYIELQGTLIKVAEELQIAIRAIENSLAKKPNMLTKIQNNLGIIECPTLILWGDQDSWFPVIQGEKLHQYIPNSQLQILPNCYHDASSGAFAVVNAAIIEFLKETKYR